MRRKMGEDNRTQTAGTGMKPTRSCTQAAGTGMKPVNWGETSDEPYANGEPRWNWRGTV